mmetsp:Transcript_6197/g.15964  ORF Transcript_6197/g.15964 Transcript_6197/m.15964 type:complete len:463 (+) Transcript_6197:197-1585(+)
MADDGASLRRFFAHVKSLKEQEDGFAIEYAEIKRLGKKYKGEFAASIAGLPCNIKKNRYKDILPFDHSRVVLPQVEGAEGSDFINANYLRNRQGQVRVIAAQGPLSSTVLDFWRMLWHQNISVVVMVARVVEMGKKKCEKYWPDDLGAMRYGNVTVYSENVDDTFAPDFVIRSFKVEYEGKSRKLTHFQYLSWPDHGVPDSVTQLMKMLKTVRETVDTAQAPMVVHCSAGCGRTGTLAAIDDVWTELEAGPLTAHLDIFDVVNQFRQSRSSIVQTHDQYFMIFKAIIDLIDQFKTGLLMAQTAKPVSVKGGAAAPGPASVAIYGNVNADEKGEAGADEPGYSEPLYINMASVAGGADARLNTLRTLTTLQRVKVDDVVMAASADDEFDEVAEEPDAVEDRNAPLDWATSCRDVSSVRSSMDKFDRMDFDRKGHRIERPIGPRAPTSFKLNTNWFPVTWASVK